MSKQGIGRKIYYTLNSGKNPKYIYYIKNVIRQAWPKAWLNLDKELAKLEQRPDKDYIMQRVDYYCQLLADTLRLSGVGTTGCRNRTTTYDKSVCLLL